ncbi:MAG: sulfatase-like hydrolase/transferase, partial [Bryobacter sp.]|nr:sulfatase-like hydrolase/transferase [Bryobacter sp.]
KLGCYGDRLAVTPNIDKLAAGGVRFTNAFASSPVCSAARSCLITGRYVTSTGMHHHRSRPKLPPGVRGFPALLREAGYYTTNRSKTDYNVSGEAAFIRDCWDESGAKAHWRNRPHGKSFFSVFNFEITHQSRTCAWPYAQFEEMIGKHLSAGERTRPSDVVVPPYYPDTPIVRRTLAREYDCVRALDKSFVGPLLRDLEQDGLLDDTIVFFFSDHGTGLPRGKRTLYDSGMRVPLIIKAPPRVRPALETCRDSLISFVDFAPTVLSMAGVPAPPSMQGRAFSTGAQYVYGSRDRIDEAFDFSRSVRDKRWLYIRNYHPHVPLGQPEYYSKDEEIRHELARQPGGFLSERPAEELYDTTADPHQVKNLATSLHPQLPRLRSALERWMVSNKDRGFVPEEELWAGTSSFRQGAFSAAQRIKMPGDLKGALADMRSSDASTRFWGVVRLRTRIPEAGFAETELQRLLEDPSPAVRLEAASTLAALAGKPSSRTLSLLAKELDGANLPAMARAARILWSLGPQAAAVRPAMQSALDRLPKRTGLAGDDTPYLYAIRSSLQAALEAKP